MYTIKKQNNNYVHDNLNGANAKGQNAGFMKNL